MKYWMLALLPLLIFGCHHKVTNPEDVFDDNGVTHSADGLFPLRTGNWWEYNVAAFDSSVSEYNFRRMVKESRTIANQDFFLLVDSMYSGGVLDTFCYMRYTRDAGVIVLDYPPDTLAADTLFMYPNVHAGSHYLFHQDSIEVLHSPPGGPKLIGDSLHTVMDYERFTHDGRQIITTFASDSSGVIMEEQISSPGSYRMSLTNSHVVH